MASSKRRGRSKEALPQSNGSAKGAKRRRITKAEPEPMDIDPPQSNRIALAVAKTVQASAKSSSSVTATPSVASTDVSDTSPPTANRYVPKAPPTVEQVLDGLRRPKSLSKKNKSKKQTLASAPKPPPPTPAILTPRLPQKSPPAAKPTTTAPIIPRRRRFIYRATTFLWFAVMIKLTLGFVLQPIPSFLYAKKPVARIYSHIQPPNHVDGSEPHLANITLRDFLSDEFHLALAPAFFGIFAYTGTFMAWTSSNNSTTTDYLNNIQSVAGASAGAMAAVILAAGIEPHKVATLGKSMTLQKFADPPAIGGVFRGDKFEQIMEKFLQEESPNGTVLMEDAKIPVACTVFDLKTMQGRTLTSGSMAKAARASATFPLLFQPVLYDNGILIDGGITDMLGLRGLAAFTPKTPKRVVNVAVGGFLSAPPGPKSMPDGIKATEVLSVSIINTPLCGPWAMANGPRAIEAARRAMEASLDLKLYHGKEEGHYELHVDALSFVE